MSLPFSFQTIISRFPFSFFFARSRLSLICCGSRSVSHSRWSDNGLNYPCFDKWLWYVQEIWCIRSTQNGKTNDNAKSTRSEYLLPRKRNRKHQSIPLGWQDINALIETPRRAILQLGREMTVRYYRSVTHDELEMMFIPPIESKIFARSTA